ncbi:outer membrane lipoprotein LolB [Acidovorax sp. NCPPB 2350]|nr:outer membrane lipoprotein LolB [Acidovorax sp. NCPPB 2350]
MPVLAKTRRRGRVAAAMLVVMGLFAAGCAQPPRAHRMDSSASGAASTHVWSGRMALQVDDSSTPPVNAGFELSGRAEQGELVLLNPLGNVLATLEWTPTLAVLKKGDERRESPSLDALVQELTGSPLPVAALFAWLQGERVNAPGWDVDMDGLERGRLVAHRHSPPPQATLRIALDR